MRKVLNLLGYYFVLFFTRTNRKKLPYNLYMFKKKGGKIGTNCEIYPNVCFGSEPYLISIGNNCRITDKVTFITHDGGMWVLRNLYSDMALADKFGKIVIGNNVHIGWNVVLMPGITVGNNVVIGCGAVITKDIPDNSVVVGVPGKVIENIELYYEKNKDLVIMTKNFNEREKKNTIEAQFL